MHLRDLARPLLLSLSLGYLGLSGMAGCQAVPPPKALTDLEPIAESAKAKEASQYAPQQYAYAKRLKGDASQAHDAGDTALAALLAEHSRVAFERAFVLARTAKAHARLLRTQASLKKKRERLSRLDEEQALVAKQASALELQARVIRDTEPLGTSDRATPQRELARRRAALALSSQARLLCSAAQLLSPKTAAISEALSALDELDDTIARRKGDTPIDQAVVLRGRCLKELTQLRRAKSQAAPEKSPSDALLSRLSQAGHEPRRDDRGVVVTLRNVFTGTTLSAEGQASLNELGRAAKAHPDFPVVVAVHRASGATTDVDQNRSKQLEEALRAQGITNLSVVAVGSTQPLVPRRARGATGLNERIEFVFVSPTSL